MDIVVNCANGNNITQVLILSSNDLVDFYHRTVLCLQCVVHAMILYVRNTYNVTKPNLICIHPRIMRMFSSVSMSRGLELLSVAYDCGILMKVLHGLLAN